MHDPHTVAFEIKRPWPEDSTGKYYPPIVTIWHVDPECNSGERGLRGDDSCGWFTPPTTPEERQRILKMGDREYSTLFGKQHATAEGESYAYICYEPSAYDAIYWAWRQIKFEQTRYLWKYGRYWKPLSQAELAEIYSLASNPVDNLRGSVAKVKDAKTCGRFFLTVYKCFIRFNRPWYRHPRWHFWHWELQVHPWQKLHRRLFVRCARCGKAFGWNESPISFSWNEPAPLYHMNCSHLESQDAKLAKTQAKGTA